MARSEKIFFCFDKNSLADRLAYKNLPLRATPVSLPEGMLPDSGVFE